MQLTYQWSEDGIAETCEQEDYILEADTPCYHCGKMNHKGDAVWILSPILDNDKYIMCIDCARKNTLKKESV